MSRSRNYRDKHDESFKRERVRKRKDAEKGERRRKNTERELVREWQDDA